MAAPLVLSLASCSEPALVGGKAAGLGRLIRNGFRVPPGLCLTTLAYHDTLRAAGVDEPKQWARLRRTSELARGLMLEECRRAVESVTMPQTILDVLGVELDKLEKNARADTGTGSGELWAVRSSASDEDAADASFGGLYRTILGVPRGSIATTIIGCWASLWTLAALAYRNRGGWRGANPAMAVILQPLLSPRAAGVAHSRQPITGQADQVVINAVFGLAEPLVSGLVMPDQYVVEIGNQPASGKLLARDIVEKTTARVASTSGLKDQQLPEEDWKKPALVDHEALGLAALVKDVERVMNKPVDVEWAMDSRGTWLLQARPIPDAGALAGIPTLSWSSCVWSRANFKETLPELPSRLALSFVQEFMETNIVRHYREIGCRIPPGLSSVRIIQGRPYINVTLFQSLMAQLGGDPDLITEQVGGAVLPAPTGVTRLAWWRLVRATVILEWKIWSAIWRAPARFAELKSLGGAQTDTVLDRLTEHTLRDRLELLHRGGQQRDLTFAIVSGVSQALYALGLLLARRVKEGWRPLLNAATQGLGGIISANQILRLVELAEIAQGEPVARDFLLADPWEPDQFRTRLIGTRFLESLDAYLKEYGHRAVGESDVMSPRFAETPEYLLGIIRGHLLASAVRSVEAIRREQEAARQAALSQIRAAFGWRLHEWAWFWGWHRALCRYLELREANRHHLMQYVAGVRRVLLLLGGKLATRGVLASSDDLFFLTQDEIRAVLDDPSRDWKSLVASRRAERARHAAQAAFDLVSPVGLSSRFTDVSASDGSLRGTPISVGYAEGPVRLVLSPSDMARVKRGDILVAPVIDPGMAPLFGLAAGLVVEMGGTLSHGAIIAREYGIPAVANVHHVTRLLKDGERVAVDASHGEIRRLEREDGPTAKVSG
ncbi:MAG: PEP/pyruvate-binding domain-containing protein [Nitrospirota bacterium]